MAFTINRPAIRGAGGARLFDPIWLVAGAAMIALAAAISACVPEESLAIFLGLLIFLLALADFRTGFLAFVVLYALMPDFWGVDLAAWMPFLNARRICSIALTVVFLFHAKDAWDTPRVKRVAWMLAVLVAMELLVGVISNDPLFAVKRIFGDVLEFYVPFLIAAHLFRTKSQVRALLTAALISLAIVSVLAIVEHTIDYDFYDSFTAVRPDINYNINVVQTTRGFAGASA